MISEVRPSAITIPHDHGRDLTVLLTVIFAAAALLVAFVQPKPQWASHAPSLALYLAVVAAVSAGLLYRGWRTGVRFDDHGVTIRHFLWTGRLGWHEVSHFRDGRCKAGTGEDRGTKWALEVVLRNGQVVKVKATARDRSAAPKVLAAVSQAAERYGIEAPLTGVMPMRRSRGSAEENSSEPAPSPATGIVLSDWAASRDFSTTRLRPGYDIEEVDAFLEAIRQTFLGIREPPLTAEQIRTKRFATTRLRPGYDEEEVDAFLDAAESRLAASTRPGRHDGLLEDAEPANWLPAMAGPSACSRRGLFSDT